MTGAIFVVLAGAIGGVVGLYLPELPGLTNSITFVATVASITGAVVGMRLAKIADLKLILTVSIIALIVFLVGFILFRLIANGPPGFYASLGAFFVVTVMFFPIGMITELAGVRFVSANTKNLG